MAIIRTSFADAIKNADVIREKAAAAAGANAAAAAANKGSFVSSAETGQAAAGTAGSSSATGASQAATDPVSDYLQQLIAQYNATPTWQSRTADELREQAEGEYKSYYDKLRLASQQNQEFTDLMLQQQKEGLGRTYDKQREASAKQYASAYSNADRQLLSRGMQRSSYAAQTLANIDAAGAEAQQDIWDQQAEAEGNIEQQRMTLAYQLAQQLSQYDASEANDVLNRIRALEEQDYERGLTSAQYKNQLSAQIYQFLYQNQRDKVSDTQWEREFNENVRQFDVQNGGSSSGGSGGSGSGGSSSNSSSSDAKGNNANKSTVSGVTDQGLLAVLNGYSTTKKASVPSVKAITSPITTSPVPQSASSSILGILNKDARK